MPRIDEDGQGRRGARADRGERPPGKDRVLHRHQPVDDDAQVARFRLDAGEALDHRHVAQGVRDALREVASITLDGLLHGFGVAQHQRHEESEDRDE